MYANIFLRIFVIYSYAIVFSCRTRYVSTYNLWQVHFGLLFIFEWGEFFLDQLSGGGVSPTAGRVTLQAGKNSCDRSLCKCSLGCDFSPDKGLKPCSQFMRLSPCPFPPPTTSPRRLFLQRWSVWWFIQHYLTCFWKFPIKPRLGTLQQAALKNDYFCPSECVTYFWGWRFYISQDPVGKTEFHQLF